MLTLFIFFWFLVSGDTCNNILADTILAPADFRSNLDPDNVWELGAVADAAECREMCIADANCHVFILDDGSTCYGRSANYLEEVTAQTGFMSGFLGNCHGESAIMIDM